MENNNIFFTVDFGVNFANIKKYPEEKLDKIIKESYNSGVDKVVCISNNIKESKVILEMEKKYPNLYFTLGIHPHNSKQFDESDIKFIESNLSNPKCYGIGECGLDYNRMFSPKKNQLKIFGLQIDLAKKYNIPLYLHCRDAWDDFVNLLKEKNYFNGLVHCFTGNISQAIEITNLGFKLGITGWIFDNRRNHDLVEVIKNKQITLDKLVVETDAPFMPIYPSKESIPSDTGFIIEEIARLKNLDVIECGKQIYSNSIKMLIKQN
jgi:TatD DNase family protein